MRTDTHRELAAFARTLMRDFGVRWWLVGGLALAIDADRCWREHNDLDIAAFDGDRLDAHLRGLQDAGALVALDRNRRYLNGLSAPRVEIEFVLSAGDASCWVYRRDQGLRVAWSQAVRRSAEGVPYLAPELVLLSKARSLRPHDDLDAREVAPTLSLSGRRFLAAQLDQCHPWQELLRL